MEREDQSSDEDDSINHSFLILSRKDSSMVSQYLYKAVQTYNSK